MSCAEVCISHEHDCDSAFSTMRIVKASKKAHRCEECRKAIPAGSTYERYSGKWDGEFSTCATCAICTEVRRAFVCGPFVFGMLWESVREEMFPVWRTKGAFDCLAKLTSEEAIAFCSLRYREWLTDNEYDLEETQNV